MKNLFAFVAAIFVTAAGSGAARADHACKADFDKFCAGKVVCGKGACHACLNEHMANLHPACQKAMAKWDEKEETKLSEEALQKK